MRQKELRIALVCYGGVSLAVYMHGVTKEIWKLASASRAIHTELDCRGGSETAYCDLLRHIEQTRNLRLRILPDILTGASAGGINAVFLAQAIHSGQSLEPLTELWLRTADVEELLDKDVSPFSALTKSWATPFVRFLLKRPGNAVTESVAPETRREVRRKLARFVRGKWFAPPFSGIDFSHLLADAFDAMAAQPPGHPLLPPGHPLDLFVTATDFRGHIELLRLNSPPVVEESEHRLAISFRSPIPPQGGEPFANVLELVFAARATASFPGAFPPLKIEEMDRLASERGVEWSDRDAFLKRVLSAHVRQGDLSRVALIDGSVLVNAPFDGAMAALEGRPAQREVDRRFVYIDPRPDKAGSASRNQDREVGFIAAIFGSISAIPREQPIRDNLEALEAQSREAERLSRIMTAQRGEVEDTVDKLFGRTLFLDRPTTRRLAIWRAKAQQAAAEQAGFAYNAYAQAKFNGIVEGLARAIHQCAPALAAAGPHAIGHRLRTHLAEQGLERLSDRGGGATEQAILFFRTYDIGFRIRRLRLLARRASEEWHDDPVITEADLDRARNALYACLAPYFEREGTVGLPPDFQAAAEQAMAHPGEALAMLATHRNLKALDDQVEAMLAEALAVMPREMRRGMLLTYLGFPFFDISTLPLIRNESLTEFDPAKVDRISPDDARSIRAGGTQATLRGIEFFNFGAFFSRAYRENDYLWGRLHGAERMIDLIASAVPESMAISQEEIARFKRETFLAILAEEEERLCTDPGLVRGIREEVLRISIPSGGSAHLPH